MGFEGDCDSFAVVGRCVFKEAVVERVDDFGVSRMATAFWAVDGDYAVGDEFFEVGPVGHVGLYLRDSVNRYFVLVRGPESSSG
jgi:hypothetical protein